MNIQTAHSLKLYNTFGIEAQARRFVNLRSEQSFLDYLAQYPDQASECHILGGGSNVLFIDNPGCDVVKVDIQGIDIIDQDSEYVLIRAGAGVVWHELVLFSLKHDLGGIENLSLIPGLCGAAPMQNIGAYGVELKDVFHQLQAIHRKTGVVRTFDANACEFAYRSSVFKTTLKDSYLISSITLRLTKKGGVNVNYGAIAETLREHGVDNPGPREVSNAVICIRQSKLPDWTKYGNAGSFFKNPVIPELQFSELQDAHKGIPSYPAGDNYTKVPAGWLIQQAGWKGKRQGDAGTWPHQALVLVNYGKASGRDLLNLARNIRDDVSLKYGIRLEPEVNLIGMNGEAF